MHSVWSFQLSIWKLLQIYKKVTKTEKNAKHFCLPSHLLLPLNPDTLSHVQVIHASMLHTVKLPLYRKLQILLWKFPKNRAIFPQS